jgi:hypothetical protein
VSVSAIIVTRGNVDLQPIIATFPADWEILVWDNGRRQLLQRWVDPPGSFAVRMPVEDLSVYGRYAAIGHATNDLIYVQDDDVIVSHPEAIIRAHFPGREDGTGLVVHDGPESYVTCNMPSEFRHDFYREHALVGFGAAFHRDAPQRAFDRFRSYGRTHDLGNPDYADFAIYRTCDVLFTALTLRVLVEVPIQHMPYHDAADRMHKQPDHVGERQRMLNLALRVRDA